MLSRPATQTQSHCDFSGTQMLADTHGIFLYLTLIYLYLIYTNTNTILYLINFLVFISLSRPTPN